MSGMFAHPRTCMYFTCIVTHRVTCCCLVIAWTWVTSVEQQEQSSKALGPTSFHHSATSRYGILCRACCAKHVPAPVPCTSVSCCACVLSPAVGCEEQASWARAVEVLLDRQVPCCFTSMNEQELGLDVAALKQAGAHILAQQRNTFSSLVPLRDLEAQPDEFYYTNAYIICFKGREAAAGASGS